MAQCLRAEYRQVRQYGTAPVHLFQCQVPFHVDGLAIERPEFPCEIVYFFVSSQFLPGLGLYGSTVILELFPDAPI